MKEIDRDRTASGLRVAGALIGTLVGGSSTIGTAQMAYTYGLSAWWFTLGGGLGVLTLWICFSHMFKKLNVNSIPELLGREYGTESVILATVFNSLGTYFSIIANTISGTALLVVLFSIQWNHALLMLLVVSAVYVLLGGDKSLGYLGLFKTLFLVLAVGVCGLIAYRGIGGMDVALLPGATSYNLFARGITVDSGAGLSLIVGVVTTQSYVSAVLTAKDEKALKHGCLLTSVLVPMIGLCGVLVGLYMRSQPTIEDTSLMLPMFVLGKFPRGIAYTVLTGLLFAVAGTLAGLSMGISTNICRTFFPEEKTKNRNLQLRLVIVCIFATLYFVCQSGGNDLILGWSFLSMGLRGTVSLVPMLAASFLPKKVRKKAILASMILGPMVTVIAKMWGTNRIDPLFYGLFVTIIILGIEQIRNIIISKK